LPPVKYSTPLEVTHLNQVGQKISVTLSLSLFSSLAFYRSLLKARKLPTSPCNSINLVLLVILVVLTGVFLPTHCKKEGLLFHQNFTVVFQHLILLLFDIDITLIGD
jgi:hypothetical protein